MIYNLYKQRGETPLEAIQRFVASHPDLKRDPHDSNKMNRFTYLGRLDPLAEGVLLIGSGEDTQAESRQKFFDLDKEYEFTAIFGFATDSYDVLGKILRAEKVKDLSEMDLIKVAKIYEGERDQKYPEYSSKVISSKKHLFSSHVSECTDIFLLKNSSCSAQSASQAIQKHMPSKNVLPTKKITIHQINFLGLSQLSAKELFGRLLMDIGKVKGDFRQTQILTLWQKILTGYKDQKIFLARFSAHVSSGTYIRVLVNEMGKTLGVGATTLSIKRNRVGDYRVEDSLL
jgi:tRNA U55 pseudouridine synthase TruB